MAGQPAHLYPRQHQKTGVVGHLRQTHPLLAFIPAQKLIARRRTPRRRTEQQTSQIASLSITIAPVPLLAKLPGQPFSAPLGVQRNPLPQPSYLRAVQAAPLTNHFRSHTRLGAKRRKEVPQKMKKSSGDLKTHRHLAIAPCAAVTRTNLLPESEVVIECR